MCSEFRFKTPRDDFRMVCNPSLTGLWKDFPASRTRNIDDVADDCGDFIAIVNVPLLGAIPSAPRILVQF
jgi:hypothetical protein